VTRHSPVFGDSNIQSISPSVCSVPRCSPPNPRSRSSILRVETGLQPAPGDTRAHSKSHRSQPPYPRNSTGPTSPASKAVSSRNSPKTGIRAKLPPSPWKRMCDPPVCDTKSPPLSATHSRYMTYHHTRNTHGFRGLRHNAPAATQSLAPQIGFVPSIASASPPHTSPPHISRPRPHVSYENHPTSPEPETLEPERRAALPHQPPTHAHRA